MGIGLIERLKKRQRPDDIAQGSKLDQEDFSEFRGVLGAIFTDPTP